MPNEPPSQPDWIPSTVAAELNEVVRGLKASHGIADHLTLQRLLTSWRDLVDEVEAGYGLSVYEYANDVSSRSILDRVAAHARPPVGQELLRWLQPLDARFEAATVRARRPYHGDADAGSRHAASSWHWRVPRKLVGELRDDMDAMGLP